MAGKTPRDPREPPDPGLLEDDEDAALTQKLSRADVRRLIMEGPGARLKPAAGAVDPTALLRARKVSSPSMVAIRTTSSFPPAGNEATVARPAPSLDVWGNAEVVPSTIPERGFDDATERGPIFVPDDLDVESIRSSREPRSLVTTQVAPEVVKLLRTRAALEGELAGTKAGFVPEPLVPMSGVESSEALLLTKKPVDPTGGLPNLDFDPPAANEVTAAMSPAAARQLLAESVKPLAPNTLPLGLTPADILAGRLGPAGSPAPPRAEPPRPEPPAPATPFAATMALGSRNDATKSPPGGLPLPTQSVQNTPSWPEVEASPRPPAVGLPAGASEGRAPSGSNPHIGLSGNEPKRFPSGQMGAVQASQGPPLGAGPPSPPPAQAFALGPAQGAEPPRFPSGSMPSPVAPPVAPAMPGIGPYGAGPGYGPMPEAARYPSGSMGAVAPGFPAPQSGAPSPGPLAVRTPVSFSGPPGAALLGGPLSGPQGPSPSQGFGAMPGQPGAMPGQPGAMPGQPGAMPGQPGAMPGQPGAMPGQPGAMPNMFGPGPMSGPVPSGSFGGAPFGAPSPEAAPVAPPPSTDAPRRGSSTWVLLLLAFVVCLASAGAYLTLKGKKLPFRHGEAAFASPVRLV
jgi:hypothetical protein